MTASRGLAASPLWGGSLSPARRVGWGEGLVALDASLAGMCARRRTYFSCTHKKSRQKKAPPSLRPLRCAAGRTCGARLAGCAVELAALLRSFAQTTPASQSTKRGHAALPAPPRKPRAAGAATGGHPRTGHRCARLRISLPLPHAGEGRGEGARGRAQRWPVWTSTPLWPCREVQGLGRARAAKHACASCSGLLRLSERRERSEQSEFRSTAPGASIAGCPQRSGGTRPVGSLLCSHNFAARSERTPLRELCLLSLGEAKESRCAAGRRSRHTAPPPTPATPTP